MTSTHSLNMIEAPEVTEHPCRLLVEEGDQEGLIFPIRETVVSIGRGPENSIQIIDARMSRRHALILLNASNWFVRDLHSKNGVQVNDSAIESDRPLTHGDKIQIGDTVFTFEQETRVGAGGTTGGVTSGVRVQHDDDSGMVPSEVVKLREQGRAGDMSPILGVGQEDDERLGVLYQVAEITISVLDQDELLDKLMDLIQKFLQPHRAGILLYDEKYEILLPKIIRRPDSNEDIIISNSIIDKAITEQAAVLVSDAPSDLRFRASESIVVQKIHSAICAPLIYKGEVLGVLYLDRRRPADSFSQRDLKLVAGIANQAALTIANSRLHRRLLAKYAQERELEIARQIQEKLQPTTMPLVSGFEISGISRPARVVGGDYYDVISLPDGRIILVVADVSGKGVPAAILLSAVRAAVQVEARHLEGNTLTRLVDRLNNMIYRDTSSNMFVTMIVGMLDPEKRQLLYCNAGHSHPMLCHADGRVENLDVGGCLLGVMPGCEYEEAKVDVPDDSILVFFSDGVTDTLNNMGETFGSQRLAETINEFRSLTATEIRAKIDEAAQTFRADAEPFDDFTLLVVKATSV